jgi:hypothetical protein
MAAASCAAASLNGKVFDARSGEPLAKVKVVVTGTALTTLTDAGGEFILSNLPEGEVELYITTIGYGLVKRKVRDGGRLDIALHPEASARTDSVSVVAGVFEPAVTNPASEKTLSKPEIQALSMVILADPLRAAQALPGVTTNNDFRAEFAVRGAAYERVGIFVDGILTDGFVHVASLGIGGRSSSEKISLSAINAETVSEISLYPAAYPARFGGVTAAVLNVETREGNHLKPAGRFSTGLLATTGVVDAPFAKGRGSWLVAGRASYVDYLQRAIERLTGTGRYSQNSSPEQTQLGFSDGQSKASYSLTARDQIGFSLLYGRLTANENLLPGTNSPERIGRLRSENSLINAFWRHGHGRFWSQARIYGLMGNLVVANRNQALLDDRDSRQIGGRGDASYLAGSHSIEGGVYVRSASERRLTNSFRANQPLSAAPLENFDASALQHDYYIQDTWKRERVSFSFGGRIQHSTQPGQTVATPRASFTWSPRANWSLRAGAGGYAQFARLDQMFGFFGNPRLRAERSTHYTLGVERRIRERIRVFAEAYHRRDRDQVFSLWEPRLVNGRAFASLVPYGNLLAGRAKGIETGIQRRSANGLTGWVSYAYMVTKYEDRADGVAFAGDFDQRHTIVAFANYRFRPTVDAGAQWRFGTGQPVPGFLRRDGNSLALAADRNQARLPNYSRLDARINKAFLFRRWKLTLSGEVLNVLGRQNVIVIATDPVRIFSSNQFSARLEDSFGILPTMRVAFEF